jgi:peptidoglycan-N-acetylglucosamine deacetylase
MVNKRGYLTIDDGPVEDMKKKVDFLDSKGIKAIWFCQGDKLKKFPEQAIYAIKKGHIIGSHGYNHPYFSQISITEAKKQIKKTDEIIDKIYENSGIKRPAKFFRFPFLDNGDNNYGDCNWNNKHVKQIQKILKDLGYVHPEFKNINYNWFKKAGFSRCINVDCSYDTYDWCLEEGVEEHGYKDLPTVLSRIDEDVPEGSRGLNFSGSNEIIMMHSWIPLSAFKKIINKILDKGIKFELPKIK